MELQVTKKKITSIEVIRKKKKICIHCGNAKEGTPHECIQNYLLADTRCYNVPELIRRVCPIEEIEGRIATFNAPPPTEEQVKQKTIDDNSKVKSPDKNFRSAYSYEFHTIENFTNKFQLDLINYIAMYSHNIPIYLLVNKDFKELNVEEFIKIHKLNNLHLKYIEEITEEEMNTILFKCRKIYVSTISIIEQCQKACVHTVVPFTDDGKYDLKYIKERTLII